MEQSIKDLRTAFISCWLLLTALLLVACDRPVSDTGKLQRESLRQLYYRDGPMPPAPGNGELARSKTAVEGAQPWERAALQKLYPGDTELWAYAIRDTDGDGIHDFRVSDYYGRFLEGDTDLDGDGVDNVLDAQPFTAGASDLGRLPAAVDWAEYGKPEFMVEIQRELLDKHRILLVERSAAFTPKLAQSVQDVLTRVYRSVFDGNGTLSALRVIAAEEASLLHADAEEGSGDFAQVLAATQTIEVYRPGIDARMKSCAATCLSPRLARRYLFGSRRGQLPVRSPPCRSSCAWGLLPLRSRSISRKRSL